MSSTPSNTAEQTYDVIVVGFGKAGKTIAMKRAKAGDRVALIERDPNMYGGTCINIGCVPTKKLLTQAHAHELVVEATGESNHADALKSAEDARDAFIAKLNAANLKMAETAGVTVITGQARFTGPKQVEVTGGDDRLELSAETIIINTGATTFLPPIPGIDGPRVHTSTSIQHIDRPDNLVIVGGGPIGMEFATLFSAYGTKVTVLDGAERAFIRNDEDVAEVAAQIMNDRGVIITANAQVEKLEDTGNGVAVTYRDVTNDANKTINADVVLVAVGRKPATEGLGLEDSGIELTERGAVKVDEHCRTNIDGVYAAGDVNGGPQFTYISFDDHRVIMHDRWGIGPARTTEGRIIPTTTFMEPPLATVGMSLKEAKDSGRELSVRTKMIADIPILPRPKIVGQPAGIARLIVDANSDEILGASLLCIDAQELINTVAVAMRAGMTATEFVEGIYTHPATSEVFNALG